MSQTVAILLIMSLIFLLIMGVIYEPAWKEILRSREARRRRRDQAHEES